MAKPFQATRMEKAPAPVNARHPRLNYLATQKLKALPAGRETREKKLACEQEETHKMLASQKVPKQPVAHKLVVAQSNP